MEWPKDSEPEPQPEPEHIPDDRVLDLRDKPKKFVLPGDRILYTENMPSFGEEPADVPQNTDETLKQPNPPKKRAIPDYPWVPPTASIELDDTEYPIYDADSFLGSPDPAKDSLEATLDHAEEIDRLKKEALKKKAEEEEEK